MQTNGMGCTRTAFYRVIVCGQAATTFERALELGVRYFDVAPSYGAGLAEMRIGRALRRANDDIGAVRVPRADVFVPAPTSSALKRESSLHGKYVLL